MGKEARSLRTFVRSLLVGTMLVQGTALFAQDAVTDEGGLAEIVVTANKRSENLQSVPVAITAATGSALIAANINTAVGMQKITPNMQIVAGGSSFSPYIRGIGTNFSLPGLENSTALYVDDVYISRPRVGFLSLADIERVEVLKGPQGTLYGRNATAGAIRIITNEPKQDFEGRLAGTVGRFDRKSIDSMINIPISENLATRFTYTHDEHGPTQGNVNPAIRGQNDRNLDMVTGKILWTPSDTVKVKLSGDYSHKNDSEGSGTVQAFGLPESLPNALGAIPRGNFYDSTEGLSPRNEYLQRSGGGELRIDVETDFATLSSITGYRRALFDTRGDEIDASSLPLQGLQLFERSSTWSQEFQAVSDKTGPFTWTAGLYYFTENVWTRGDLYGTTINAALGIPVSSPNVGFPGFDATFQSVSRVKSESFAPYFEGKYEFNDALSLTLGGRYSWESKKVVEGSVNAAADGQNFFQLFPQPDEKHKIKRFTPKATLAYKPGDDMLVYFNYSQGFKSGGPNIPGFGATHSFVDPEKLTSYELGWKTQFDIVRFNAAAFYYDYKDLQVSRVVNGTPTAQNAASAEIYGIEADLTIAPSRDLVFGLGGGYLHAQYKKFLGDSFAPNASLPACAAAQATPDPSDDLACFGNATIEGTDLSGKPLKSAPKWSGYASAQYTLWLGDSSLVFNTIANYRSAVVYVPDGYVGDNELLMVSGSIGWHSPDDRYSLTLFGDNLLNQKYKLTSEVTAFGGYYIPGDPRTWGLRAAMKF